jgi:hypothetical protein
MVKETFRSPRVRIVFGIVILALVVGIIAFPPLRVRVFGIFASQVQGASNSREESKNKYEVAFFEKD